jgi:hypothetical protein
MHVARYLFELLVKQDLIFFVLYVHVQLQENQCLVEIKILIVKKYYVLNRSLKQLPSSEVKELHLLGRNDENVQSVEFHVRCCSRISC